MIGRTGTRLAGRWLDRALPRRTIRLRLTLLYGGLFALCAAALLGIVYVLVARQYTTSFFVRAGKGFVETRSAAGGPASGAVPGVVPPRILFPGVVVTPGSVPARQLIAQATAQSNAALHQLLVDSAIGLAIMTLASLWLGWLVAGRALRPLRTITNAAREISASDLHRRLSLSGPDDELKELGRTFDGLLERLETAFEAQRRFVANASHELRTPLTFERTLVEVALADPSADVESLRRTLAEVLRAGEEQERLIEALLTLSRSQRGLDRRERVDLARIVGDVLDGLAPDGPTLDADLAPARTNGDPYLVERLVANLVANAVCHNVPGGWVTVSTATRSGFAVLSVENSGPVVPEADLERLFQPFQRLEGERRTDHDGLGLGLSIVDAIARAHGARIHTTARPDGGLAVEVSFPVAVLAPLPAPPPAFVHA
jgi:signal transduction histidine kinase